MAGTITAASLDSGASATAPLFKANGTEIGTLCRAWVNFNGTGTPAIRASFNVSSITDNGTGDYTVNFTTAMPNANYSVTHIWGNGSTRDWNGFTTVGAAATSNVTIFQTVNSGVAFDAAVINLAIFS
jgi:hypothetical protein